MVQYVHLGRMQGNKFFPILHEGHWKIKQDSTLLVSPLSLFHLTKIMKQTKEIQDKIKEILWVTEHSLSMDQRNKLIMDKVEKIQAELDKRHKYSHRSTYYVTHEKIH
jgi:hypothetical protein